MLQKSDLFLQFRVSGSTVTSKTSITLTEITKRHILSRQIRIDQTLQNEKSVMKCSWCNRSYARNSYFVWFSYRSILWINQKVIHLGNRNVCPRLNLRTRRAVRVRFPKQISASEPIKNKNTLWTCSSTKMCTLKGINVIYGCCNTKQSPAHDDLAVQLLENLT
jgi:hypothetical protein